MAGEFSTIQLDLQPQTATITLDRPSALNAFTVQVLDELIAALEQIAARSALTTVVLTGAGKAFSAGVDLKALGGQELPGGKVGDLLDIPARRVIELIRTIDPVVIAKVNGFCFTGALEIVLACDIVITAQEAVFGDTHAKFGLRPTWGMSQRLPRLVGPAVARLLSYTAQTFTGAQAAAWGLAAQSVPRSELDVTVDELVAAISRNSSGSLVAYKDLFRAAEELPLAAGLAYEAATEYPIGDTEERVAGFR
jgi:enoyl-CoA hydratase